MRECAKEQRGEYVFVCCAIDSEGDGIFAHFLHTAYPSQWLRLAPIIAPVKVSLLPLSNQDDFQPLLQELGVHKRIFYPSFDHGSYDAILLLSLPPPDAFHRLCLFCFWFWSVHPSPLTSSSLPSLHVLIFNLSSSSSSTSSSAEAMAKEGVSFRLDDSSTGIGRRYARTGVLIKKKRWWTGWGCLIKKKQYVPVCKCHSLALSTRRRDRHSLWRDCGLPVSERPHCDRA